MNQTPHSTEDGGHSRNDCKVKLQIDNNLNELVNRNVVVYLQSNTLPMISLGEKEHHVMSPGNCTKALLSTVANLLFSCCGEYQNPSTTPCTTQRLETSPDQYQRPSATRHASRGRELQTTDTGQAANYESKINTRKPSASSNPTRWVVASSNWY